MKAYYIHNGLRQTPLFKHDCNYCVFLGNFENRSIWADGRPIMTDLYYCPSENPTVISRWSSDGPDYHSGLCFAATNTALTEALRRAKELGIA